MRMRSNVKLYVLCLSCLMSEQVVSIVTTRLYCFFVLLRHHREGSKEHKCGGTFGPRRISHLFANSLR